MDNLYSSRLHGFPNLSKGSASMETALTEQGVLSLLIVLGSSVSLVGLVFAFITYSLFSDLRNLSGTALMNLLAAMFMAQLLYVVGVGGIVDPELCISLAFSLQYVRLCVLCWLLIIVHHMYTQFNIHIHTLIPRPELSISKTFFGYSLFGWGFPAALLLFSVVLEYEDKSIDLLLKSTDKSIKHNCWFLDNNTFYVCYLIPSGICLLCTLWYMICAIIAVYRAVTIQLDRKVRSKMLKKRRMQIFLFFKITLIIYGVVTLGALYRLDDNEYTRISFHVTQGLQGIIVAMLVTCNCQVLKLYSKSIRVNRKKLPKMYGVDKKALDKSTSMQLLTWEPPPDIV
ncbi:adhesion G protein-coupled receptor E3-like [Harmonia axyridis]|uniref:adhesion G protein-coupled receptor E3-like n=1 Tax=Harmonia axyridis TaxID=115357 RepID=UPI001E27564D|nr:adhesion G protein-coupled receptor E3-like [Harmonia axyridis]XP_045471201.1 adhesion G protein-coupled receptor E3-like [Harmonia axyridis]